MTTRQVWLEYLDQTEPSASARADRLVQTAEQPGDVWALARRLGASIVQLDDRAKAHGYLSGKLSNWTVRVKGEVSGDLDEDQKFTVAHELAHLLFLESWTIAGPCSKAEYWLLAAACDRVANRLLNP